MSDAVDPLTKEIANAFALESGRPRLDDDTLLAHADAIAALPGARKELVAVELTALARRIAGTEQDAWDDALIQLCLLVGTALGDLERAGAALAAGGVGADKARALVGAAASHVPVGAAGRPAGSSSPLSALLANRSKKKPEP